MKTRRAFTLVELLVVVSIISLLVSILLPALGRAKELARQSVCLTRLGGQVRAVHLYAADYDGFIPSGPATPMSAPMPPLPYDTIATNQLWIGQLGTYNGFGTLVNKLMSSGEGFYCPSDTSGDPQDEFSKFQARGSDDAYGSYLYRQKDEAQYLRIDRLGVNGDGIAARALRLDMNSEMPIAPIRKNHDKKWVGIGFVTGHAAGYDNSTDRFTLRPQDMANPFGRLDEILRTADKLAQ